MSFERRYSTVDVMKFYQDGSIPSVLSKASINSFKKYAKNFELAENGKQLYYLAKTGKSKDMQFRNKRQVIFTEAHKEEIFKDGHTSARGAHCGETKTIKKITNRFYWLGIVAYVIGRIARCDACQRSEKLKTVAPVLQCITPESPWKMIGISIYPPTSEPHQAQGGSYQEDGIMQSSIEYSLQDGEPELEVFIEEPDQLVNGYQSDSAISEASPPKSRRHNCESAAMNEALKTLKEINEKRLNCDQFDNFGQIVAAQLRQIQSPSVQIQTMMNVLEVLKKRCTARK